MKLKRQLFIGVAIIVGYLTLVTGNCIGSENFLSHLRTLYYQQDYQTIINILDKNPENVHLYPNQTALLRLLSLLALDQLESAQQFIQKQENNRHISLSDHLWSLFLDKVLSEKKFDLIEETYENLRSKSNLLVLLCDQSFHVAEFLRMEKRFNQAIRYYIDSLHYSYTESERLRCLLGLGKILTERGMMMESLFHAKRLYYSYQSMTSRQARELIEPYIDLIDPLLFSMENRFSIAAFLFQLGWWPQTIRFLETIDVDQLPPSLTKEYWILWLRVYLRQDKLDGFQTILGKTENLMEIPAGWFYKGVFHQRRGEYHLASLSYEELLIRYPENDYLVNTLRNLSFCYRVLGDEENYLLTLDRIIEVTPFESDPVWEKFWYFYQRERLDWAESLLDSLINYPGERNRALFWKYKINPTIENSQYLLDIIQGRSFDYYYARSWQELREKGISLPSSDELFPSQEYIPKFNHLTSNQKRHWINYHFLSEIFLMKNAEAELVTLERLTMNHPEILFEMSRFYARSQEYQKSQIYALSFQRAFDGSFQYKNVWKKIYPEYYLPIIKEIAKPNEIDSYLILSLIKAESTFEAEIISPVGAVGLMQLMPSTAAWMIETKMSSVKEFSEWQSAYLKDPRVNIEMGITYFAYLLEMFDQKKCPAIAAYNAGPGRLNEWITSESHGDADRFIENIPFPETQAYLKKVIQFYFLYSMIYTGHFMMDPCTF